MTTAAQEARDEAIQRVEAHADEGWKKAACWALWRVACREEEFTSDDVWDELGGNHAREGRAMGPIMVRAAKKGVISRTGRTRQATRVVNHARPQTLWRSNVWKGKS